MSTPEAWQIPSPSDACAACQVALQPDAIVTVELLFEDAGPRRRDLCAACGELVSNKDVGIYWRQRRAERGDDRPVVDYAFLREMFGRMLERHEEVYRRLAYLVGLVLIRKRHLRLKGFEQRDGLEVMVVTRGKDEPDQIVPAPFLSADDMIATRALLSRLMSSDLPEDGDLAAVAEEAEAAAAHVHVESETPDRVARAAQADDQADASSSDEADDLPERGQQRAEVPAAEAGPELN